MIVLDVILTSVGYISDDFSSLLLHADSKAHVEINKYFFIEASCSYILNTVKKNVDTIYVQNKIIFQKNMVIGKETKRLYDEEAKRTVKLSDKASKMADADIKEFSKNYYEYDANSKSYKYILKQLMNYIVLV